MNFKALHGAAVAAAVSFGAAGAAQALTIGEVEATGNGALSVIGTAEVDFNTGGMTVGGGTPLLLPTLSLSDGGGGTMNLAAFINPTFAVRLVSSTLEDAAGDSGQIQALFSGITGTDAGLFPFVLVTITPGPGGSFASDPLDFTQYATPPATLTGASVEFLSVDEIDVGPPDGVIPLPATLPLMAAALGALAATRRRA